MSDERVLVANAADVKQVKAARSKEKRTKEHEMQDLRDMLCNDQTGKAARRWWWGMMKACRVFSQTMADDPYRTAYNEGLRCVGLDMLSQVNELDPSVFALISKEAKEDEAHA